MKDFYDSHKEIALPAIIFFLTLVVFGRMALNDFAYDDVILRYNPIIQKVINPIHYFTHPEDLLAAPSAIPFLDVYRPLGAWFFAIETHFFGLDPFYFHLISLFLHAINAVLFFLLLKKILKRDGLSFAGSLIFALHPAAIETVAWIWQQSGLWSWFFSFLVLNIAFIDVSEENLFFNKKWKKIAAVGVLSFIAIFLKDHAIVLPFLYILCLLYKKKLRNLGEKTWEIAAVVLPAIIFIILRNILLNPINRLEELWGGRYYIVFLTMMKSLVYYFRLLVWPYPLSVTYDSLPFQKNINLSVVASFAFLLLLALSAIFLWRKRTLFSMGVLWIFIVLAPISNIFVVRDAIMNERFLYFTIPGFILAISAIAIFIKEKFAKYEKAFVFPSIIFLFGISAIFGYLTFFRLADWKNDQTLWKHEVDIKPNDWRAQTNYAFSLELNNQSKEAIGHYKKALGNRPSPVNFARTAKKLALAQVRIGEGEKAEFFLLSAQKIAPGQDEISAGLGQIYLAEKKYNEAAKVFERLAESDKSDMIAFFVALAEKLNGENDEKIKSRIEKMNNPIFRLATSPLIEGRKKMMEEKYAEAITLIQKVLSVNSLPMPEPYLWLGESFEKTGQTEKALAAYQLTSIAFSSVDASQGIIRNGGKAY